jgi:hypothetical protein
MWFIGIWVVKYALDIELYEPAMTLSDHSIDMGETNEAN